MRNVKTKRVINSITQDKYGIAEKFLLVRSVDDNGIFSNEYDEVGLANDNLRYHDQKCICSFKTGFDKYQNTMLECMYQICNFKERPLILRTNKKKRILKKHKEAVGEYGIFIKYDNTIPIAELGFMNGDLRFKKQKCIFRFKGVEHIDRNVKKEFEKHALEFNNKVLNGLKKEY